MCRFCLLLRTRCVQGDTLEAVWQGSPWPAAGPRLPAARDSRIVSAPQTHEAFPPSAMCTGHSRGVLVSALCCLWELGYSGRNGAFTSSPCSVFLESEEHTLGPMIHRTFHAGTGCAVSPALSRACSCCTC